TDVTEPNDNMAESGTHPNAMSLGQHLQLKGSLSYVPDPEYIALDLPSLSNPATLHAKLTVATSGGRFAALPGPLDPHLPIRPARRHAAKHGRAPRPPGTRRPKKRKHDRRGDEGLPQGLRQPGPDAAAARGRDLQRLPRRRLGAVPGGRARRALALRAAPEHG